MSISLVSASPTTVLPSTLQLAHIIGNDLSSRHSSRQAGRLNFALPLIHTSAHLPQRGDTCLSPHGLVVPWTISH